MTEPYASETALPGIEIPLDQLDPDTVDRLVESFVLREGTDYGEREASLKNKTDQVLRQLTRGEATIVFDPNEESFSILQRAR